MRNQKDEIEREIVKDFERGRWKSSKNTAKEIQTAKEAAANYLKKDARINIRLSSPDLRLLKRKAAEEGMPYQTLIASILHKFATGRVTT
jgi:predicted DNA binding CopG/RHH family protein